MSIRNFFLSLVSALIFLSCTPKKKPEIHYRDKNPSSGLYEMSYETGNWPHPDYKYPFESPGNHRILVEVDSLYSGPVQAIIPWRRPDSNPEEKAVLVFAAGSGVQVTSMQIINITNDTGHLVFVPLDGQVQYYIYYLPHSSTGGYYPKLTYLPPEEADPTQTLNISNIELGDLPAARILCAQSIDEFHSFYPMEVVAKEDEINAYLKSNSRPYYLFPEYRTNPIKMDDHLPLHWIKSVTRINGLSDTVKKGEYYTFQIGVWTPGMDLQDIQVSFSEFISDQGTLPSSAATCFNLGGTDLNGKSFKKQLDISKNEIKALWCGVDIPKDIQAGNYKGEVIIRPKENSPDTIFISLLITKDIANNHGDDKPYNMSRLRWLNSTIGSDNDFIAKPYTPVKVSDKTLRILGRDIELNPLGFPSDIQSFFSQEMTKLNTTSEAILAASLGPEVLLNDLQPVFWKPEDYLIRQESPGKVSWSTSNTSEFLELKVDGALEYDGMLDYRIRLIAREDTEIEDFILRIPLNKSTAKYMLGLGYKGGIRPNPVDWKWDVENKHQEGAWLGNVNKGIQYVLRGEDYERPLNTNFYRQKPLKAPASWHNNGKGGIHIQDNTSWVSVENYSGSRKMLAGDTLHFNVRFLITPFKLINTKEHFTTRFVHKYVPVDSVVAWNGTIVNVHHANAINPYINYPFYNLELQKEYIEEAHEKGIKVKLYNTIRELTYKAHELFAFRSLDYEILNDGEGGGHSWLQEHLRKNYHSAWHATSVNDAAILNKGNSRWTNYYVEGINWLAEQQQIDGLYLDDIAFSRTTVKRLANVLQKHRDGVVIDLHSANQFNARDGFNNSAFLYMEHMPYITRLWFGEYFEYDLGPDYWLTEVSGIPFGLTGEMLEGGGHPWRGLVYGMTSRIYGDIDMRPIWGLFDDFDIANSEMLGYWVDRSPIKTEVNNIRSSIYMHNDRILIAIGSWSGKDEMVPLEIEWDRLGFDSNNSRLYSPEIKGLQKEEVFQIQDPVPVKKGQGRVLILEK